MSIVKYIGVDDPDLDLFESQYEVPEGMCYNSYLISDEKIAIMDSVDPRKTTQWLNNLKTALNGQKPTYLIVQHMEPDHSGSVAALLEAYPETIIVASAKALQYLQQFNENLSAQTLTIADGDTLSLGKNSLKFIAAAMVHWPEVMVTYLESEQTLFAADGFGKFGVYNADPDDWACEARRYYFNICGKYGVQVATLLSKASALKISKICPLHGPVLEGEKLSEALRLYNIWSKYDVETPGGVLVAYASIHGGTKEAAEKIAQLLKEKGASKVAITDLSRDDMAEAIEDAFRYDRATLLGGLGCGLFMTTANNLQQMGMVTTSAGKAGFITAMYILIVPVLNVLIFKKKERPVTWAAVAMGLAGLYLLCAKDGLHFEQGDVLIFFCAVFFSGHILCSDRFAGKAQIIKMSFIQFVISFALSTCIALFTEDISFAGLWDGRIAVAYF